MVINKAHSTCPPISIQTIKYEENLILYIGKYGHMMTPSSPIFAFRASTSAWCW